MCRLCLLPVDDALSEFTEHEVDHRADDAKFDEQREHLIGADVLPRFLQAIADAGRCAGKLRRDEAEERERDAKTDAGEDMRCGSRDYDAEEFADARCAERNSAWPSSVVMK